MPSCNTYHLTWVSLTLGVGYLFMAASAKHSHCSLPWMRVIFTGAVPGLQRGVAPLGLPSPAQPLLPGLLLPAAAPGLGLRVALQGHRPWPRARGGFSRLPLTSDVGRVICLIRNPALPIYLWVLLHLIWVSLTLGMGYLFMAAPAKCSRCSLPWTRSPLLTLNVE